jgi:molybdate transport system substrate-binding protein
MAVGDPDHVPAGIYARQALSSLGMWRTLAPRLARADNVRAALALVERGEVPLGIIYATDARITRNVRVLGTVPDDSHDPITYPFAMLPGVKGPEAVHFFTFLLGDEAMTIFLEFGFVRTP